MNRCFIVKNLLHKKPMIGRNWVKGLVNRRRVVVVKNMNLTLLSRRQTGLPVQNFLLMSNRLFIPLFQVRNFRGILLVKILIPRFRHVFFRRLVHLLRLMITPILLSGNDLSFFKNGLTIRRTFIPNGNRIFLPLVVFIYLINNLVFNKFVIGQFGRFNNRKFNWKTSPRPRKRSFTRRD